MTFTRRQVIQGLLGLGGWMLLPKYGRAQQTTPGAAPAPPLFDPAPRRTLMAAMERVLPGATEAGVIAHVEFWLRHPHFTGAQREFIAAAVLLDRIAHQQYKRSYADCKPAEQDAILKMLQEGKVREKGFDGSGFFSRLVSFTLEGFLADPKYGGNRGQAGWRFIGHRACWWAPKSIRRVIGIDQGVTD